jgi:hypothetical protein
MQAHGVKMPKIIGGRYGLASKEFNAGMAKAVFDELKKINAKHNFTIGIDDDVTHTSLDGKKIFRLKSSMLSVASSLDLEQMERECQQEYH